MSAGKNGRILLSLLFLAALFLVVCILSIGVGTVSLTPSQILQTFRGQGEASWHVVVVQIRLPRLVLALLLGGALALSGYLLQTFFGNPLAGPYVLGISSGAKAAVAAEMVFFSGMGISAWSMTFAAFLGAMMVTASLLMLSRRLHGMAALLVAGIMLGYICTALTELMMAFAQEADIVGMHNWSRGSFSGASWAQVKPAGLMVAVAFMASFLLAKPMRAYRMGEAYAASLGVRVRWLRIGLVLLSSLLSACVTAFAGPVSFVGIAVPIMIRRLLGTTEPLTMLPCVFLGGAAFCAACDLLARTISAPSEMSLSAVTAFLGAPVVIATLMKRQGRDGA